MFKSLLAAALASSSLVVAYANTNAGSKVYISSASAGVVDLLQADYEALSWVEVKSIGNLGETGTKTNILNYDTWDTNVIQKAKGLRDAGSPTLEVARLASDPGQTLMRTAAKGNQNWAFKVVRNDAVTTGATPTVIYYRGLVAGPARPNGKNEDFDLEVFTLGMQQEEIVVDAGAGGNKPVLTVAPALSGTMTVGQVITLSNGTWTGDATIVYTYQWFADGNAISGATAGTFTIPTGYTGKHLQARVQATNLSGTGQGWTALGAAIS